ncbi:hypothetical protein BT67DRAFT_56720 [Trichocladium antarcticum]|uniref:Uncharacterized protein n=1 Tax=Trichocladium antarcticum TaxID=1450529 RepID=A0AAN6UK18_9PEZI|nr:hypothetical protein BT67DRAFT_56720 [Trichocladium antarcticum]
MLVSRLAGPLALDRQPGCLVTDKFLGPVSSPLKQAPPVQTPPPPPPGICTLFCWLLHLINRNSFSSQSGLACSANCFGDQPITYATCSSGWLGPTRGGCAGGGVSIMEDWAIVVTITLIIYNVSLVSSGVKGSRRMESPALIVLKLVMSACHQPGGPSERYKRGLR